MIAEEIELTTFEHLSDAFWARMIPGLFDAHKRAHEVTFAEFERPEADDLLGFTRRAKVEANLRGTALLFPDTMDVNTVRSRQGPWHHVEVRSGPVVLTASTVANPGDMVEPAEFRESLAHEANVLRLNLEGEVLVDRKDHPLYAILLHSKYRAARAEDRQYAYLPGSAYLAFPNAGCDHYLHTINLFDRYADLVARYMPQEWDAEAHVRYFHGARRFAAA
jgi:hypothetical protein